MQESPATSEFYEDSSPDPLGAVPNSINIEQLIRWSSSLPKNPPDASHLGNQEKAHQISPFPLDMQINRKIILWKGSVVRLQVQAVVNSTNETLSDTNLQSNRILAAAGIQLKEELVHKIKGCRTGDAKLTLGFKLPARYIIHTVGPKYNSKYQTAAESALFSCYFKTLGLAKEHKLTSIALAPINSVRRGYPPHEGAHIALRTVRRFLEKGSSLDTVIFAVEDVDIGIYELLLPLYFPRTQGEEEYAMYYLPTALGGENGEPFIPERQIRIVDKPFVAAHIPRVTENADNISEGEELFVEEEGTDLASQLDSSVCLGKTAFAKMHGDLDKKRKGAHQRLNTRINTSDILTSEVQRKNKYERLLRKARTEDLRQFANMRCLYQCGEDRYGRPVVLFVGHRLSFDQIDLEKVVLFLINTLDPVVQRDYTIVYFHTLTTAENHPSMQLLKQIYDILDYKYKKNLRAFYIIHPTFWTRFLTWWFTTFTASSLKNKMHSLGGIEYLYSVISPDQLDIPPEVLDYDIKVNGVHYCRAANLPNSVANNTL